MSSEEKQNIAMLKTSQKSIPQKQENKGCNNTIIIVYKQQTQKEGKMETYRLFQSRYSWKLRVIIWGLWQAFTRK